MRTRKAPATGQGTIVPVHREAFRMGLPDIDSRGIRRQMKAEEHGRPSAENAPAESMHPPVRNPHAKTRRRTPQPGAKWVSVRRLRIDRARSSLRGHSSRLRMIQSPSSLQSGYGWDGSSGFCPPIVAFRVARSGFGRRRPRVRCLRVGDEVTRLILVGRGPSVGEGPSEWKSEAPDVDADGGRLWIKAQGRQRGMGCY